MTVAEMHRVAELHIAHFERLIATGGHGVRLDECQHYLAIWRRARGRASLLEMGPDERAELRDYCDSEALEDPFGARGKENP